MNCGECEPETKGQCMQWKAQERKRECHDLRSSIYLFFEHNHFEYIKQEQTVNQHS